MLLLGGMLALLLTSVAGLSLSAAFCRSALLRLVLHTTAILLAIAAGELGADWVLAHRATAPSAPLAMPLK